MNQKREEKRRKQGQGEKKVEIRELEEEGHPSPTVS